MKWEPSSFFFPFSDTLGHFFILSSFITYSCKLLGRMTKTTHQEVLQSPSQKKKKKGNIMESRNLGKCLVTRGAGYTGSSMDDAKFKHHPSDTGLSEAACGTGS